MTTITLTVNGETRTARVEARTQLAELLRGALDLTGTHLGCEQGICGACTVLVDGKPVRSCITYAAACDGIEVTSVEGFGDDPVMADLRAAFSRHHALQCGFCTPGMLITARDIVTRLAEPDEARIRHELSGNLCRCTGYVGIVAAITDVIATRGRAATPPDPAAGARPGRLSRFEIAPEFQAPETSKPSSSGLTVRDGWTSLAREIELDHPGAQVWAFFEDLRQVSRCLPGARIDELQDGHFSGTLEIKFGPIRARFGGTGTRTSQPDDRRGTIEGRGADANGHSNVRGQLTYALRPGKDGRTTLVGLDLRFRIQGMLAQFNRSDLVESFADIILDRFASNAGVALAGGEIDADAGLNLVALLVQFVKAKFRAMRNLLWMG